MARADAYRVDFSSRDRQREREIIDVSSDRSIRELLAYTWYSKIFVRQTLSFHLARRGANRHASRGKINVAHRATLFLERDRVARFPPALSSYGTFDETLLYLQQTDIEFPVAACFVRARIRYAR